MNHIPYEIARMRRDDLLHTAAKRRQAALPAATMNGEPSPTLPARPRKLRRLWQLRSAGLTDTSQTRERTLDGRL
jgi:hypothetical protein